MLEKQLSEMEELLLFSGKHDSLPAILTIHAGAGGTEAQDWCEKLMNMYVSWARSISPEGATILDLTEGTVAGITEAVVEIRVPQAYGLLKGEEGVHRIQRVSPYDSKGRRHTSFAAVSVAPILEESYDKKIEVPSSDVEVQTFRGSGPGGQHRNKTESAVRLIHKPTGTMVTCQASRSQGQNKEKAWQVLSSLLLKQREQARQAEIQTKHENKPDIGWGHHRRTYVFDPATMVHDHMSGLKDYNLEKVLSGEIEHLLKGNLFAQKE